MKPRVGSFRYDDFSVKANWIVWHVLGPVYLLMSVAGFIHFDMQPLKAVLGCSAGLIGSAYAWAGIKGHLHRWIGVIANGLASVQFIDSLQHPGEVPLRPIEVAIPILATSCLFAVPMILLAMQLHAATAGPGTEPSGGAPDRPANVIELNRTLWLGLGPMCLLVVVDRLFLGQPGISEWTLLMLAGCCGSAYAWMTTAGRPRLLVGIAANAFMAVVMVDSLFTPSDVELFILGACIVIAAVLFLFPTFLLTVQLRRPSAEPPSASGATT